jgi:DtxR family Mn-dependent transcriptional regulator
MPSITVENYIKQIYIEQHELPGRGKAGRNREKALVSMGKLAAAVGVTPGTATTMIKTLDDAGLVTYEPRGGVRLTRKGEKLALLVLRRHRLVELFLVQVLGLDWSDVHKEAEELEHAISELLLEKIDDYLGRPSFDPHGDPIPAADGTIASIRHDRLSDADVGEELHIARVVDQDSRFLRFVQEQGLKPGAKVTVEKRDELADALTVRLKDDQLITLGTAAAAKIQVRPS